jgi:hypothetical protein
LERGKFSALAAKAVRAERDETVRAEWLLAG